MTSEENASNEKGAFFNDPAIKEKYLGRVRAHRLADQIVHGVYWQNGKGCAVGCTVETSYYPHWRYPVELGIPEWLAYLEDMIFESLPNDKALSWPEKFLEAIPVGADLTLVRPRFLVWLLSDEKNGVLTLKDDNVKAAINRIVSLLQKWIETGERGDAREWHSAGEAAGKAANSGMWSALDAAITAAWAASNSVRAVAWASRAAKKAWVVSEVQASKLLELLRAQKRTGMD